MQGAKTRGCNSSPAFFEQQIGEVRPLATSSRAVTSSVITVNCAGCAVPKAGVVIAEIDPLMA